MPSLIEDKLAIEERIAAYNQSLDQGRYADFLACWAEDGVFDGLGGPYVGKPAIRDFISRYDERYRLRLHGLRHFTVNILSQIDGDLARSSAHLQLVSTGPKGVQILFTGVYADTLRREGGQWLFTRRRLFQDMAGQPAAVPTPD
jgi:ketosteroid isomerase-like protein